MSIAKFKNTTYQKGQTVILVVLIMFVASFIGVTVSSRFIKGLRGLVSSDNVTKATGVAEALIERLLLVPSDTLVEYINNSSCGSECALQITDTTGQQLTAIAVLSLVGNTTDNYPVSIEELDVGSITLTGYTSGRLIYVCWNGTSSVTGMYIYSESGETKSEPFAYNAVLAFDTTNGFGSSNATFGYQNCFSVTATQTPIALRLTSVYGRTDAQILPEPGYTIPIQGINIDSTGRAGDTIRKITVIKSTAFAPAYFDYTLFQKTWDDSLSN